ncbi:MAG: chemotaxis protein CheX [Candidatus Sulfotelmatobacter sp.]|jgi:chemotaxis protein CheX
MSAPKTSQGVGENHEQWRPVVELASQEVFDLMVGSPLVVAVEPPAEDKFDITGMVGLAGQICGMLTVRCSLRSGAKIASKMLGVEVEKAGAEMSDALGEICNMIAGNFKNKIAGLGDGCMLSVPTVITGQDYTCRSLGDYSILRVNFAFEGEQFLVVLEIHG